MSSQGGASDSEDIDFSATGLTLVTGLQCTKTYHRLQFMAHAGYELNINGKSNYDQGSYLIDNSGDPVKIDWSGFRAGIGIGITLKKIERIHYPFIHSLIYSDRSLTTTQRSAKKMLAGVRGRKVKFLINPSLRSIHCNPKHCSPRLPVEKIFADLCVFAPLR